MQLIIKLIILHRLEHLNVVISDIYDMFNSSALCAIFVCSVRLLERYYLTLTLSYVEMLNALCANWNEYGS